MPVRPLGEGDRTTVAALLDEARRCDGRDPLSEQKLVDFATTRVGLGFVLDADGEVAGYAHALATATAWEVELVLAPEARTRARYGSFTGDVVAALPAGRPVHVWAAQLDHVAALEALGYQHFRELRQMRRRLPADPPPELPAGVELRSLVVGRDEGAWLDAYRLAFAEHPEGSDWDREELARRFRRAWFDPADFLLAWDGDEVAAFCWTKVHDAEIGEIYIIGVHPAHRGRRLGRTMVLVGLDHLHRRRGCEVGMLYVDADNVSAVKLYESLGFHEAAFSRCFLASSVGEG